MLEKLSNIINNFIKENEILDMDDFYFSCKMIEIFDKHYKNDNYRCHKKKVLFEKSYRYSYDFLKSISLEYAEKLEKLRENNNINVLTLSNGKENDFKKIQEETHLELVNGEKITAYTVSDNGVNKVLMSPQNTLIDSYVLTHEFVHTISLSPDESVAASIFCESLSFLSELLQDEYFNQINVKESHLNKEQLLRTVYESVEALKVKLKLIQNCLNNGKITASDLKKIVLESKASEIALDVMDDIIDKNELSTLDDERYVIGIIFAYYMLDRIHTDKRNIQEFIELNEMIDFYIPEEFVSYLDLEYVEESDVFDLTDKSYEKLEQSFVKTLKKR